MRKQLIHFVRVVVVTTYYLLVAFPLVVSAGVTLAWDANNPTPDGYNVFKRTVGQSYNYTTPLNTQPITGTSYPTNELQPGVTYYFVVQAVLEGNQSGDSNEVMHTEQVGVTDSDGDGVADTGDAFPGDPHESVDTDGDGMGNNQDPDDDGDGMPDSYEMGMEGMDPLVDDAEGDLDGDNVSNKDEYDNGTDPTQETNYGPARPELSLPAHQETVSLTPTLVTYAFSDANGDSHAETRYQIAVDPEFEGIIFDRVTTEDLTDFRLIELILDPDTIYYWRAKFIDDGGADSQWSLTASFTTVDFTAAGDQNANGILDSQEVADMAIDLDGNQVPDAAQTDLLCVATSDDDINPHVSVKGVSPGVEVVALRAIISENIERALSLNGPDTFTGLISFKLYLAPGATIASIEIYFTAEAPEGAQYYYRTENGWVAYTDVVFSQDRKSVIITIEDGGDGDQDGIQNGVIVDPAGLGYSSQTSDSSSFEGTEQTSCFIDTPMDDIGVGGKSALPLISCGLFGLACLTWLQRMRQN